MTKLHYLLTIKAEDRPGLLHLITGLIEKKLLRVISASIAPTDVHDIVLITIELVATEHEITTLSLKLENIVEVFGTEVKQYDKTLCLRAAWFKLDKAILTTPKISTLQKYGAVIVIIEEDTIMVAKYGTDEAIQNLYTQLDDAYLLGFSQTGLIGDTKLIDHDDVKLETI